MLLQGSCVTTEAHACLLAISCASNPFIPHYIIPVTIKTSAYMAFHEEGLAGIELLCAAQLTV